MRTIASNLNRRLPRFFPLLLALSAPPSCSVLPSHFHNEANAKLALKAQADMAEYAKNAPAMYSGMATNVEKFKGEEEYLLAELAKNFHSALVTALPTMTINAFKQRAESGLALTDLFETNVIAGEAIKYLKEKQSAQAADKTADAQVQAIKGEVTKAKSNVAAWNANMALLRQGFKELPDSAKKLDTTLSVSQLEKAASDLGKKDIIYADADGTPLTNKVSEIVVAQAKNIGFEITAKAGTKTGAAPFPEAPGIALQIMNLALELAQLQRQKAETLLSQLDARAVLFEDALAEMRLARQLLTEARTIADTERAVGPKLLPYVLVIDVWSRAKGLETSLVEKARSGTNTLETLSSDASGYWGSENQVAEILLGLRKLAIAESILARNQSLFQLKVARLEHQESIANSALNDATHQALIKGGLSGLVAFHQSGFSQEDAANIIRTAQAISLAVIAGK